MHDLMWTLISSPDRDSTPDDADRRDPSPTPPPVGAPPDAPIGRAPGSHRRGPLPVALVMTAVVVGVLLDVTLHRGELGLATAVGGLVAMAAARFSGSAARFLEPGADHGARAPSGHARLRNVVTAVGCCFAVLLSVRSSAWLRSLDTLALLACIALAADAGVGVTDLLASSVIGSWLRPAAGVITVGQESARLGAMHTTSLRDRLAARRDLRGVPVAAVVGSVGRGIVLTAPVVGLLAVLLMSADRMFADYFRLPSFVPPDLAPAFSHAAVAGAGFIAMLGVVAAGSVRSPLPLTRPRALIARREVLMMLWSVNALFAFFVFVQIRVASVRGRTYADYAREGFFQLLAAASITLVVIASARRLGGVTTDLGVRSAAVSTCAMTLALTFFAHRRLALYESVYGLTETRVVAHVAIAMVAVILAITGVGVWRSTSARDLRGVTTSLSLAAVGVAVIALNVVNPAAASVDSALRGLRRGDDGRAVVNVPEDGLLRLADRLRPSDVAAFRTYTYDMARGRWCGIGARGSLAGWSVSAHQAVDARRQLCSLVASPRAADRAAAVTASASLAAVASVASVASGEGHSVASRG